MDRKVLNGIAVVVAAMWALTLLVGVIWPARQPPATVHAVMMVVVTGSYGATLVPKRNGNGKKGDLDD